jgi:hypothetical protein
VCYYDVARSRFVDELGRVLHRAKEIVGEFGLGIYLTMDDKISDALGLPIARE